MIINKTETLKIMLKKIAFLLLFIAPMSVLHRSLHISDL